MSRINIELTIDGDAEDAYRSIDHLLDHNVIQEAIDGVKIDGSRPVRVTCAIAVQVIIPKSLHAKTDTSVAVHTIGEDKAIYEFATFSEAEKFAETYNRNAKLTGIRSRALVRSIDRGAARMRGLSVNRVQSDQPARIPSEHRQDGRLSSNAARWQHLHRLWRETGTDPCHACGGLRYHTDDCPHVAMGRS